MPKKSNREILIETIMNKKYGSDELKYDIINRAFLETLNILELNKLAYECFEDDFDDDL